MTGTLSYALAERLRDGVAAAMREAADLAIMPYYRALRETEIAMKAPGEVVTVADRACEAMLGERLSKLHPEARVVGEEAVSEDPALLDALATDLCWIVDPLDGTANFAKGTGPFGMLVALSNCGTIIGGWLFDPIEGRFCGAEQGHGARVNGVEFRAPAFAKDRPVAAVSGLFADPHRRDRIIAALADCTVTDSPRCAADQYPRVANGEHDLTYFDRTISWDHAAGVIFLNECGGKAAHPDGSAYRVDQPRSGLLVATTPELWASVAADVAAAL